jgi:hypothetical protein
MVSCQEPASLNGSKHSQQCHTHDSALVNALSFVSMGVEARRYPCHSTAHCWHMKRQPSLCNCCRCCSHCHCNCRCCLHCHWCLCCHCCQRHRSLLLSPLPLAIAVAVAIAHHRCHLFCITVSHCHCCCPCPCQRPLPSLSPLAIAVAISIGHHPCRRRHPLPRVVALACQEL